MKVMIMGNIKTYSELISYDTYEERLKYCSLNLKPGTKNPEVLRWLQQVFYKTKEWLDFRDCIILRDNGCDLGIDSLEIYTAITIHHLNPITTDDVIRKSNKLLDPNNVISVSHVTHNAIHYGNLISPIRPIERAKNDTCPWKRK